MEEGTEGQRDEGTKEMNGGNGSARGVRREGAQDSRGRGAEGGVPLALAIPQAAERCRADRDLDPVCVVIERAEITHAIRCWDAMQYDFPGIAMSLEADHRTAGARSVLLFRRRD